jgi:hypothetical protein
MQVNDATNYQAYSINLKATSTVASDIETSENGLDYETKEKIKKGEISAKSLSNSYLVEFSMKIESYSSTNTLAQSGTFDINKVKDLMTSLGDLKDIGYTGKAIKDLSTDEAKALVSEDGYFGIAETSQRLADFVLSGSGNDIEKLKAGREGIIKGFKDAEAAWGDKLPDISYKTLDKALEKVDKKIEELGGNAIDTKA